MALTLSGTNGIVGAGFTVDNSGVSVTAGVGTFSSIGVGVSIPVGGLTGTISEGRLPNHSAALLTTGTVPTARLPSGSILQVVQTVKTDRSTLSLATNTLTSDIMTVSITPSSTSSKILLQCTINGNCTTTGFGFVFNKGGTDITGATGDAHGSRRRMTSSQEVESSNISGLSGTFLDSPSTTSATTYGVKMAHSSGGTQTISINHNDESDLAKFQVTVCTLTAMEVAG